MPRFNAAKVLLEIIEDIARHRRDFRKVDSVVCIVRYMRESESSQKDSEKPA